MEGHLILGLGLFALFASGAIFASTAAAEETLLAEWLLNGTGITTLTSTETKVSLILRDTKVPIAGTVGVECDGITFDGSVGTDGEEEVTEVLNIALVSVSLGGTELSCGAVEKCEEAGKVAPINLPWHMLLELVVTPPELFMYLMMEGAGKTLPGYEVTCRVFGVTQTDTCTFANHSGGMVENGATEVLLTIGAVEPSGTCSIGGAGSGVITVLEGAIFTLTGTLQVSSV